MEYRLDLNTLLLMLKRSTGSLYAEIPHIPGVKGHCQVFLRLEQGLIQTCVIKNEYGSEVASGETALKLIQNQALEWHYREEKPPSQSLLPARVPSVRPPSFPRTTTHLPREAAPRFPLVPLARSPIPFRRTFISQRAFLSWPRLYRAVYSLIDGKTSVDDIVRLLAHEQQKEHIMEVIDHLHRERLIGFTRDTRTTGWL